MEKATHTILQLQNQHQIIQDNLVDNYKLKATNQKMISGFFHNTITQSTKFKKSKSYKPFKYVSFQ